MATVAVMGANGNIGGGISERLLAGGHTVRALGRSAEKLAGLKARGAEILLGDAGDEAFLTKAFAGADAVFTLVPPTPVSTDLRADMDRLGTSIAGAIGKSGVRHAVALSSIGGERPSGTGPIAGLHAQEEHFAKEIAFAGQTFDLLAIRNNWGGDRVSYVGSEGRLRTLPVEWTDVHEPDLVVTLGGDRACFRADLLRQLRTLVDEEGDRARTSGC